VIFETVKWVQGVKPILIQSLQKRGFSMAKTKVTPDICSYVDEEHLKMNLEISLPGVKKENIRLRMHEDSLNIFAPREDFDYASSVAFCCPVKPGEARSTYENGLLKVEVPFKDLMEDAVDVQVR
jgi:HSP20 family molecular chaperone IbpA